ncbi:hypothetical protein WDU94_007945 [Cyamophila willieti]
MRWKFNSFFTLGLLYHSAVPLPSKMCSIVKMTDSSAALVAAQYLKKGCVVALPTDTLYGLACDCNNSKAINHLYQIKNRDSNKPLAICVSDITDIPKWADIHNISFDLLAELLPGPVTLLFNRSPHLNLELNPNVAKVAVRIPDHAFLRQLLKLMDFPLALTSANPSNEPSTLCISEFKSLWNQLGVVIDGGVIPNPDRFGSTIIDLSETNYFSVLRQGVCFDKILKILNKYNIVERKRLHSSE